MSNQLAKIKLNITDPIKMDSELEMGALSLFVGANGVGKSLILKIAYALGATGLAAVVPQQKEHLVEGTQFIWDNTFTEQNFNGTIEAAYKEGTLKVVFDKGKVTDVVALGLVNPSPVVFMSSDLRTFDAMARYLQMRRLCGDAGTIEFMHEILKNYRLYDVSYMEGVIMRCPILIPANIVEIMADTYGFDPVPIHLEVDLEQGIFNAALKDGGLKNVTTYGKGHQAILNMFIGIGAA